MTYISVFKISLNPIEKQKSLTLPKFNIALKGRKFAESVIPHKP